MHPHESIPKILLAFVLVFFTGVQAKSQTYKITYNLIGKDTLAKDSRTTLQSEFDSREKAVDYIRNLRNFLFEKGYAQASVDSFHIDTTSARVFLFIGEKTQWLLRLDSLPALVKSDLGLGNRKNEITENDYSRVKIIENKILDYYANNGYPFATLKFENSGFQDGKIITFLKTAPGVLYHIDSIKVYGKGKIKSSYLQHYLGIFNGDVYNKSKLDQVGKLIADLPFLQEQNPWSLTMLGTGSTLNLFLEPRRSSEINALIGFLPGNSITGKTKVTADVTLNLKNALGGGETFLLNWQQLQAQSPRLDLGLNLPYLFNTPYGLDASFSMWKQDSSWLLLTANLGGRYFWSAHKSMRIFYQMKNSYLLQGGVDTNSIKISHQLPPYMDVRASSGGLSYQVENTNYVLNPRRGNILTFTATAGIRKVSENSDITQLKDPSDPAFDFSSLYDTVTKKSYVTTFVFSGSHFIPVGEKNTLKISEDVGWMQSPQAFQNELFRIGGAELLRGFDEKSIFADRYSVTSVEFRTLTGINSYMFVFSDFGLTHTKISTDKFSNSFISAGLGLRLETKVGLLNLAYAIGKRNDVKFDIRNASKIHFGYINYF